MTLIVACNDSKEKKNATDKTLKEKSINKKYKYSHRIFVDDLGDNRRGEITAYISKTDTIYTQTKLFKNNILDTVNSHFYDFELYKLGDNKYSGKITLHSDSDKINDNYTNELSLFFKGVEEKFVVKNQNFIEFEFNKDDDTLSGMLMEIRSIDTVIKGEEMVRILETYIPVDTKSETDNPFIEGFELKGLKFK